MIDPTWKRGNYLGRAEVKRYLPRRTLRLKLSFSDRTDLRMTLGISKDPKSSNPDHEMKPEAFNGWPLFGRANAGHVPLAGPDNDAALEVGIDLTPLFEKLEPGERERSRIFVRLGRAENSKAKGVLHEAGVRSYDSDGTFQKEVSLEIPSKAFGKHDIEVSGLAWHSP